MNCACSLGLLLLASTVIPAFAQQTDTESQDTELEDRLESLQLEKTTTLDRLHELDREIAAVQVEIASRNLERARSGALNLPAQCRITKKIFSAPSVFAEVVGEIPANSGFLLASYAEDDFFLVDGEAGVGYLRLDLKYGCKDLAPEIADQVAGIVEAAKEQKRARALANHRIELQREGEERVASRAARGSQLREKYGDGVAELILEGKFWIAMSSAMARDSLGEPDEVNRTGDKHGVTEQWVYSSGSLYLYFEKDRLVSWQDF